MEPASNRSAPIVLASASPRRRDLLAAAGLGVEVRPAQIDERALPGESPRGTAVRLAREKARVVARQLAPERRLVLGADTIVVLGGALLGKPRDRDDAVRILGRLVGHSHEVITALAVVCSETSAVWECAVSSRVTLRPASGAEIERYVDGDEPLDKAGAYAIQGEGRRFVARVEGSETNVIGLPVEEALALIAQAGEAAPT